MLPEIDLSLDIATFDIFQPIQSTLPKLYNCVHAATLLQNENKPKQKEQKQQQQQLKTQKTSTSRPISASVSNALKKTTAVKNDSGYCKACKKKFSNQATFDNHLKSAKHNANEKKMKLQKPTSASSTAGESVVETPAEQHVEVLAAIAKLSQLKETLNSSNVATTAEIITELYQISQQLFSLKRPRDTGNALRLLIDAAGNTSSRRLINAQTAFARLLYVYHQMDECRSEFLDLIGKLCNASRTELLKMLNEARNLRVSDMLHRCTSFSSSVIKKTESLETSNILDIFLEVASVFGRSADAFMNIGTKDIATVLYAIGLTIAEGSQLLNYRQSFKDHLIRIYCSFGDQQHRIVELHLLNGSNNPKDLFEALLLSLEIDDLIRAKRVVFLLKEQTSSMHYPDVQFLLAIYESILTVVPDSEPLIQQFQHLQLLLNATVEPMLLQSEPPNVQKQTMNRLQELISYQK